jgi:hypothetical protein
MQPVVATQSWLFDLPLLLACAVSMLKFTMALAALAAAAHNAQGRLCLQNNYDTAGKQCGKHNAACQHGWRVVFAASNRHL